MVSNLTLIRGRTPVSREEVTKAPIVVAGSGLPDDGTSTAFDTDDELLRWKKEVG